MDELIKRRDAEKALTVLGAQLSEKHTRTVAKCICAIKDVPAFDAQPVIHEQWDKNGRCTNCGGHAPFFAMATTYYKSPYCHECGAKMDLEEV